MSEILIIDTEVGRIDKVVSQHFTDFSRSQVQNWVKQGLITVNGQPVKANYAVTGGDRIVIDPPAPQPLEAVAQPMALDIVYEDQDVIVVNKPQGMVVHPAPGHPDGTLVNGLLAHTDFAGINDVIRPGIVHRIDKDTSGLLMVAKNGPAQLKLAAQLKENKSRREYLAIVHGTFKEDKGTINAPLGRDPRDRKRQAVVKDGRPAVTHFQVLERFERYTLVKCVLETGRTHQIRVHMAYIHHPVAGDPLYGPKRTLPGAGQFLHAHTLSFTHPTTGELLTFTIPVPPIFEQTLTDLRNGVDKTQIVR